MVPPRWLVQRQRTRRGSIVWATVCWFCVVAFSVLLITSNAFFGEWPRARWLLVVIWLINAARTTLGVIFWQPPAEPRRGAPAMP